jgi:hypothetical protein
VKPDCLAPCETGAFSKVMNFGGDKTMDEELANLRRAVSGVLTERRLLIAAVHVALEYFEDREDTVDGPDGEPQPNCEMRIASDLRDTLRLVNPERTPQ